MIKKSILFIIFLILVSCKSSYNSAGSMKFKDREGVYENKEKNIRVTVANTDNQNLKIDVYSVNGVTVNSETFDINSGVNTGNFTLRSAINNYNYIINFYGNTSLHFSVREGTSYKISNKLLNNTTK